MSVMCSPTGAMGAMGWPLGLAVMLGFWGLLAWGGVMVFRTLTGFDAKVGAAGLQVPVDGDTGLEELAEALERLLGSP